MEALAYPEFEPSQDWLRTHLLFYDRLSTIVPKISNFQYSDSTRRLLDMLERESNKGQSLLEQISPTTEELHYQETNFNRISMFVRTAKTGKPAVEAVFPQLWTEDGESAPSGVLIRAGKFNHSLAEALTAGQTEDGGRREGSYFQHRDDGIVVPHLVATMLLTVLADGIGRKRGLSCLTSLDQAYALNALQQLENIEGSLHPTTLPPVLGGGAGWLNSMPSGQQHWLKAEDWRLAGLASTLIRVAVPANIGAVSTGDYVEIWKRFSDLRESLPAFVKQIDENNLISTTEDWGHYQRKLQEAAEGLKRKIETLAKSRIHNSIRSWMPFSIGALLALGSALVGNGPTAAVSGAEIQLIPVGGVMAGIGIEVLDRVGIFERPRESPTVHRLSDLNRETMDRVAIKSMSLYENRRLLV